jgi:hypothetical protein
MSTIFEFLLALADLRFLEGLASHGVDLISINIDISSYWHYAPNGASHLSEAWAKKTSLCISYNSHCTRT